MSSNEYKLGDGFKVFNKMTGDSYNRGGIAVCDVIDEILESRDKDILINVEDIFGIIRAIRRQLNKK